MRQLGFGLRKILKLFDQMRKKKIPKIRPYVVNLIYVTVSVFKNISLQNTNPHYYPIRRISPRPLEIWLDAWGKLRGVGSDAR
jgi:hypothetical protein